MGNTNSTKLKLLHLLDILEKDTDEDHPMSMPELQRKLSERGIDSERKSIYRDINALEDFSIEISGYEQNRQGYFLLSRDFDLNVWGRVDKR